MSGFKGFFKHFSSKLSDEVEPLKATVEDSSQSCEIENQSYSSIGTLENEVVRQTVPEKPSRRLFEKWQSKRATFVHNLTNKLSILGITSSSDEDEDTDTGYYHRSNQSYHDNADFGDDFEDDDGDIDEGDEFGESETCFGGGCDADEGTSSASEYGGEAGTRPVYANRPPVGRCGSITSLDSMSDAEAAQCRVFLSGLMQKIFEPAIPQLDDETLSKFKLDIEHHTTRSWFAKEIQIKRADKKLVSPVVLEKLSHCCSLVLLECNLHDDFGPARILMNMCFTFFTEIPTGVTNKVTQRYLYETLKDQPIWISLRFWNAAFFESIHQERQKTPSWKRGDSMAALINEKKFQENTTFGQLNTFAWNMASLGLSKRTCLEFVRKQSIIADLHKDKIRILRNNVKKLTDLNTPEAETT